MTLNQIYDIPIRGLVFQCVDHIATQEQEDGWFLFSIHVGNKISDLPNALHLPDIITLVDGNENDYNETDVCE